MICVVLQPAYIPWRGYFHQIQKADLFVFYDDVQYIKRDWRSRNRVKTEQGSVWLSVPVLGKGSQVQGTPICEVAINHSERWAAKHLGTIEQSYRRAPYFDRYLPMLRSFYEDPPELLADFTIDTTIAIARELGLDTEFVRSSTLPSAGTRTARVLSLLTHLGADHYITGPSAAAYLEEERFAEAGITLEYMRYDYPEYPQLHPPFDPQVSIVDLLMMTGPDAGRYIWRDPASGEAGDR